MELEPYLVASALNGVVAQRLARTICPNCRTTYFPSPAVMSAAGRLRDPNRVFYRGEGCQQCHDTGFRGRRAIFEIMTIDDGLCELIHGHADEQAIRAYLRTKGWCPLRDEGLGLVEQGLSTIEEVLRVTYSEQEATIRAERTAEQAEDPAQGNRWNGPLASPQADRGGEDGAASAPAAKSGAKV